MVMGTVEQDTAKILVNEMNLPITEEEFRVQIKELQRDGLSQAQLLPGWLMSLIFDFSFSMVLHNLKKKKNVYM